MYRMFLDIHVLQTVPPSNLNRDDTGSPKTAVYGGVRRARVSSQAWKRATRQAFQNTLERDDLGVRTKQVVSLVADRVSELVPELAERADALATDVLKEAGIKLTEPRARKDQTEPRQSAESGYLLFLSRRQVNGLAELAVAAAQDGGVVNKGMARRTADSAHSIDIALFGRMVADATDLSVDAAVQVAHALSVHAVDNEFDYFTALDDRSPESEPGAGMIGTVEFNSATLYRYATVDVDGLQANLGDVEAAARAVEAFLRAFVTSMPSGKQNTFANRTLPDAVVVQVRERQPVNLVGAFEEAVVGGDGVSRLQGACERLAEHSLSVDEAYGTRPSRAFVVRVGESTAPLAPLGEPVGLDDLVHSAGTLVRVRQEAAT